jgi:hypothetical protein
MPEKMDVKQGTLALMILKTLEVLGPLHCRRSRCPRTRITKAPPVIM